MSEQDGNALINNAKKWAAYAVYFLNTYTWLIFGIIFFIILKFYLYQWDKQNINYDLMKRDFKIFNPRINPISEEEYKQNIPIRDYFVMSSYNSCAGGDSWQDWVDINILEKLIKMGVRGFDFELYMKDDKCVVAVGPEAEHDRFMLKGTFNYIPFKDVLQKLDADLAMILGMASFIIVYYVFETASLVSPFWLMLIFTALSHEKIWNTKKMFK